MVFGKCQRLMKNLLSISLLTIYLFANTELNQVFDTPQLLEHFKQHHAANKSVNFVSFLIMHYCTDDGIATDNAQDNKLPFKHLHRPDFGFYTTASAENNFEHKPAIIDEVSNSQFTPQCILPVYLSKRKEPPRFIS